MGEFNGEVAKAPLKQAPAALAVDGPRIRRRSSLLPPMIRRVNMYSRGATTLFVLLMSAACAQEPSPPPADANQIEQAVRDAERESADRSAKERSN